MTSGRRVLVSGAILAGAVAIALATSKPNGEASPDKQEAAAPTSVAPAAPASSQVSDAMPPLEERTCADVTQHLERALEMDDEILPKELPDEIVANVRHAVRPAGAPDAGGVEAGAPDPKTRADSEACKRQLYGMLKAQRTCGRAAGALAAGLFGVGGVLPADIAKAVRTTSPACALRVIESSGFAGDVDDDLAKALEELDTSSDAAVRRTALLAYGSLGELAWRIGRTQAAERIDRKLNEHLATARGEERLLTLRAAGNAGCRACLPKVRASLEDPSPEIRRAASSAFRFVDTEEAVRIMCKRLTSDTDSQVRDVAAWSMQWRHGAGEERATCLARAATKDAHVLVRQSAAEALGLLAKDSDPAHEALVEIAGEGSPIEVRNIALGHLMITTERAHEVGATGVGSLGGERSAVGAVPSGRVLVK